MFRHCTTHCNKLIHAVIGTDVIASIELCNDPAEKSRNVVPFFACFYY